MRYDYGHAVRVDDNGAFGLHQLILEQENRFGYEDRFALIVLQALNYYNNLLSVCRIGHPMVNITVGLNISNAYHPKVFFNDYEIATPVAFEEQITGLLPDDRNSLLMKIFDRFYYTLGFPGVQGCLKTLIDEYIP